MTPVRWMAMTMALICSCTAGLHAREPAAAEPQQQQWLTAGASRWQLQQRDRFDGGHRRSFLLQSQRWPDPVRGAPWLHRVELLQPDTPTPGPALLVINNGVAYAGGTLPPGAATDVTAAQLETLVRTLGMAVVSIADVPPQAMALPGDPVLRIEDDLVAASWRRFLDAPATHAHWPLQLPMTEAARRALDLADHELPAAQRPSYVVTGLSKRGWTSWLLTLGDERISHLAPLAIDMHWEALAPHIQRNHGGRWPVALTPYVQHGITDAIGSPGFAALMRLIDPYRQLQGPHHARLGVPKLLLNASGDDFFPPDASSFYFAALPGPSTLRMAPNSDHAGIRNFSLETLLPALRRWRSGNALPQVRSQWDAATGRLQVSAGGERARTVVLWQAHNPHSRDFRHACGVRYTARALPPADAGSFDVALQVPTTGWSASFVELHYADGLVVTTPAQVLPHDIYPQTPPAERGGRCRLAPLSEAAAQQ